MRRMRKGAGGEEAPASREGGGGIGDAGDLGGDGERRCGLGEDGGEAARPPCKSQMPGAGSASE